MSPGSMPMTLRFPSGSSANSLGSVPSRASRSSAVGVVDLDAQGAHGRTHRLPRGGSALRWHALFSSPFFHPTVLVDREVLDRYGLRYDPAFLESEDYDLWTRLFALPTERTCQSRSSGSGCTLSRRRFDEAMFSSPFSGRSRCGRSHVLRRSSAESKPSSPGASQRPRRLRRERRPRRLLELARCIRAAAWPRQAGA